MLYESNHPRGRFVIDVTARTTKSQTRREVREFGALGVGTVIESKHPDRPVGYTTQAWDMRGLRRLPDAAT